MVLSLDWTSTGPLMDLYRDFESHNCSSAVTQNTLLKFLFEVEGKQHSGSGPSGPLLASPKPVLDLSWAYTGPTGSLVGRCWTSTDPHTGRLLCLYWTCAGPRLDLYSTSTGPLLAPDWASTAPVLDLDWASTGPLLDFH